MTRASMRRSSQYARQHECLNSAEPSIDERLWSSAMIEFPFPFRLDDGITGELHRHSGQCRDDARLDPREAHLKAAAAAHLPRILLLACTALGIGFWLIG